jgi:hypothetical protein
MDRRPKIEAYHTIKRGENPYFSRFTPFLPFVERE